MSKLLRDAFLENMTKWFGEHFVYLRMYDHEAKGTKDDSPYRTKFEKLQEYNSFAQKTSVFFTPNGDMGLVNTRSQGKDSDATMIRCIFVDIDLGRENGVSNKRITWSDFPFKPTVITETYNGYHLFFMLKEPIPLNDVTLPQFKDIMRFMTTASGANIGADPKVVNPARFLRLPGFYYRGHKQGETDTPFMVDVIDIDEDATYTFQQFIDLANEFKKIDESKVYSNHKKMQKAGFKENNFDEINKMDVRDVLADLCDGKYQIVHGTRTTEGGEVTNGLRYRPAKNALTNFAAESRPHGSPYSVALWYKKTDAEVYKYFRDRWKIGIDYQKNVQIKTVKGGNIEGEVIENYEGKGKKKRKGDPEQMSGVPVVRIDKDTEEALIVQGDFAVKINFQNHITYITSDDGDIQIMDASLKVIGYYIDPSEVHVYIVEYHRSNGEQGIIYLRKLGKKNEIKVRMSEKGITFYGNDKVENFLTTYIHSTTNQLKYIDAAGIYSKDMIINKAGCYMMEGKKEKYFVDIGDLEPKNKEKEIFHIGKDQGLVQFREDLQKLETTYKESIMYSLFLGYAIGLFSHHIREEFKFLPSCGIVGVSASGKTTARELILEMLGLDYCTVVDASTSKFAAMSMSRHYLPITAGEYDETTARFVWDGFLKSNYDGTQDTRGTSDQKTIKYPANCSRIVDGETGSMTNSVNTRKIAMQFSKSYQRGLLDPKFKKNINGYLIHNYEKILSLKDRYNEWRSDISKQFEHLKGNEKERVIDNYTMLIAFADCFGFADIILEPVLQQAKDQFALAGDDMIPKLIKLVLQQAIINKLVIRLEGEHLNIDFIADTLRLDARKLSQMQSNIKNVNHFFNLNIEGGYTGYDKLEVPLEYIFKSKELHPTFNAMLNYLSYSNTMASITEDGKVISALKLYAISNGYTKQRFYEVRIKDDIDEKYEKLRESEQDKDKPF